MTKIGILGLLAASLALCSCSSDLLSGIKTGDLGQPDRLTFAQSATNDYRIGPQDKLSIAVFPDKGLSLPDVRVNFDGTVLVPPLGILHAGGRTPQEFTSEVQTRLKKCCLQDPLVSIQVVETLSQRITIFGAVKAPNNYNLSGRTTLTQAIAMAGGADDSSANTHRVGVIRYTNGARTGAIFDMKAILSGKADDPEVFGGDSIIVDSSAAKTGFHNLLTALPLATFLRF